MKKTICLLLSMMICTLSFAQYARRGSTISVNGQPQDKAATIAMLSQMDQGEADLWRTAATQRAVGIGLTAGGFTVMGIGLSLGIFGPLAGGLVGGTAGAFVGNAQDGAQAGVKAMAPAAIAGLVSSGLGLAAGIVGIVQISSAKKKMNGIVERCNASSPVLSLGAAPSGMGITYRF